MSEKWRFSYPSVAEELSEAGHVRAFFDIPKKPLEKGAMITLRNKKEFAQQETPEPVYTSFPTFTLYLLYIKTDFYYGNLRFTGLLPNIYLQRPNGIIYIDGEGRLTGFNETFYRFFRDSFKSPRHLLNKPVSLFMEPSISQIQADRLAETAFPDPVLMKQLYRYDPAASGSLKGVSTGSSGKLQETDDGLVFTNLAQNDYAVLTLTTPVPARRDFMLDMEFTRLSGFPPLIFLDKDGDTRLPFGGSDYSLGPDVEGGHYQLKRRGIVQKVCSVAPLRGKVAWRFCRSGRTFMFFEDGECRLFLHDPNELHEEGAIVSIALRTRSACCFRSVGLFTTEHSSPPPALPVTRLKIPFANAFVVNPMDNITLSSSHQDILGYVLENATEMQVRLDNLKRENQRILAVSGIWPDAFLGKSAAFLRVKETAAKVAGSDVALLLQGETGTGKEALAQFIHRNSRRKDAPFIKVDCATLPRDLIESELFGHERGAFTGAMERREGLLEQANNGTLFLDEIGNLSREVQAKLLHFLQDHAFTRIGGRKLISIDVRIIAASNVLLSELLKKNEFRADLYYRMEVVSITLPPLRDRKEDIPELCRHFIRHFNSRHERKVKDLSPAAYAKLFSHSWPGNVRELRNTMERAVIFSEGDQIPPELITLVQGAAPLGRKGARPLKHIDAEALQSLFQKHGGVAQRVAAELGVSAPALYEKIAKLGLTPGSLRNR